MRHDTTAAYRMHAAVSIQDFKRKAFVDAWSKKTGGGRFSFKCTDEETSYITPAKDAMLIHSVISDSLGAHACESFVDAFACVGGDTLAAMHQFKQSVIYSVQPYDSFHDKRFKRLESNIASFKSASLHSREVHAKNTGIKEFIELIPRGNQITVFYLDPPWSLGPNLHSPNPAASVDPSKRYSLPVVLGHFLDTNVFTPLRERGIFPKVIALKLPGIPRSPSIGEMIELLDKSRYRQYAFLAPRSKYAVYIFRDKSMDEPEDAVPPHKNHPSPLQPRNAPTYPPHKEPPQHPVFHRPQPPRLREKELEKDPRNHQRVRVAAALPHDTVQPIPEDEADGVRPAHGPNQPRGAGVPQAGLESQATGAHGLEHRGKALVHSTAIAPLLL